MYIQYVQPALSRASRAQPPLARCARKPTAPQAALRAAWGRCAPLLPSGGAARRMGALRAPGKGRGANPRRRCAPLGRGGALRAPCGAARRREEEGRSAPPFAHFARSSVFARYARSNAFRTGLRATACIAHSSVFARFARSNAFRAQEPPEHNPHEPKAKAREKIFFFKVSICRQTVNQGN